MLLHSFNWKRASVPHIHHDSGTDVKFELGWAYFVLVLFMLIGGSNAVNLTDGLDGLLSGTAAIAFGAFSIIAVAQEQLE